MCLKIGIGSKSGVVDVAVLPEALSVWMLPGVDLSADRIEGIVGNKRTINLNEFIKLCDSLNWKLKIDYVRHMIMDIIMLPIII